MKKLILLLLISLISLNCATSTKKKLVWDANNKMNEVFFIGENFDYFKKKSNDYMKAVENEFNKRNIKNTWTKYDEKVLNIDKKLAEKIQASGTKYVLIISLYSITNRGVKTFTLEIVNAEQQKTIWEGSVFIQGLSGSDNFSRKVMKELEKNNIINALKN